MNFELKEIVWDGSRMMQMGAYKYKYNAEGIRQEKEVNGRKHIYYTQGTKLLAEKITEEGQPDINKQYLYAGEKPIGFVLNGKPYQYLYNGLGNLVRVFDAKTGRIAAEYSYTAFGSCTVTNHTEENIGNQNPIRYKGYYYDEETRLYYLKSRYYSPDYRVFLSPDEPEYMDPNDFSGLNLYTYCYNNPVNMYDPTGHFPVLTLILGISALIGLGLTIGGVASNNNVMTAIGLTMVAVPALVSGIGALFSGATYLSIMGGATTLAGVGTSLFASAEYQEVFTGNNWMIDAGLSEEWYNGLMLTTASLATAGTLATGILTSIGNVATPNQMMYSFQNNPNRWKTVKELIEPGRGKYKGGVSTYSKS